MAANAECTVFSQANGGVLHYTVLNIHRYNIEGGALLHCSGHLRASETKARRIMEESRGGKGGLKASTMRFPARQGSCLKEQGRFKTRNREFKASEGSSSQEEEDQSKLEVQHDLVIVRPILLNHVSAKTFGLPLCPLQVRLFNKNTTARSGMRIRGS